ncbi:MAG: hypothetical protein ACLPTZ_21560 [Beijerinckiaceae bacterium]
MAQGALERRIADAEFIAGAGRIERGGRLLDERKLSEPAGLPVGIERQATFDARQYDVIIRSRRGARRLVLEPQVETILRTREVLAAFVGRRRVARQLLLAAFSAYRWRGFRVC